MKKLYIFLPIVLVFIFACKKPKSTTYEYVSEEIKDYMVFKKGSYWIYRNMINNKEDSVWVDSTVSNLNCYPVFKRKNDWTRCEEDISIYQKSTFNDTTILYLTSYNLTDLYINKFNYIQFNALVSIKPNEKVPQADSIYKVYDLLNHEYKNVAYRNYKQNAIRETWIAQNVGVIRLKGNIDWYGFDHENPCDLQLVRYNIVQ